MYRMLGFAKYFENSCYERDMRNELLGLEPRCLLKPGSVPTLYLPTTHTYPSDSSERASRAKKRVQQTADDIMVHDTTLAVTRLSVPSDDWRGVYEARVSFYSTQWDRNQVQYVSIVSS